LDELNKTNQAETWKHLPRFGGWIETDRGQGLMIELVRDADHLISRSLLDYLWTTGHDERVREAVASFGDYWQSNTIPSRSLGLHNIAAQLQADGAMRLVLIDGLGSTEAIPLSKLSRTYGLHRARKKVTALREDIGALMIRKQKGLDPGPYGFLLSRE
jgi:PhoP regulatory network protein YrbL